MLSQEFPYDFLLLTFSTFLKISTFFFSYFFSLSIFFFGAEIFFLNIDSMQKIVLFRFMRFSERSETGNPANERREDNGFHIIFFPEQQNPLFCQDWGIFQWAQKELEALLWICFTPKYIFSQKICLWFFVRQFVLPDIFFLLTNTMIVWIFLNPKMGFCSWGG